MDKKRLVDGTTALAEKRPRVIKIEPAERPQNVRLRVAAYTRVSSDSEDQLNSFAAQNRYYTELISGKAEWRMVDIYADEGITGTSVAKRDDFQRMMADCRRGLIDQILVKSISRFARNTKDCLQNIRELKELGVNVRFEREGIDTVNVSSELITAIYAAFAQKESESISGNMRWSYQRRMESGEFNTCKAPWGFRLDGRKLKICESEADIVQRIFREYLSGKNPQEIADDLNASCLTERVWNYKAVDYILQNERYAGNALLQKRYTPDMLSRQQKTNHGEREMYFVPGSNDAIISPELFERAQVLRQKRSLGKAPVHSEIISQIRCICGARMRFKNVRGKWYLCCTSHDTKAMNIRKAVDYSTMFATLESVMKADLPQMELYCEIGKAVCARVEKGAAVVAAEFLKEQYPDMTGFSPRNVRRMRDFWQLYSGMPELLGEALRLNWTQNVVIMEAELTAEERRWYIRQAAAQNLSKSELLRMIENSAHLESVLDEKVDVWYNEGNDEISERTQYGEDPVYLSRQYLQKSLKTQ